MSKPKTPRLNSAAGPGIGLTFGIAIGAAMGNVALGIALGVTFGLMFGAAIARLFSLDNEEPAEKN